jgi:peptide/nickel transport system ATP-binding protein
VTELIRTEKLTKAFFISRRRRNRITAVNNVSLRLAGGESLGVIGESGSGKSTLGRLILQLSEPTAGDVYYRGRNLRSFSRRELKEIRPKLQPIFQEADEALDPRFTVRKILAEPLTLRKLPRMEVDARIVKLLKTVNLGEELLNRHPHELSGGQRQRIGMARALAMEPELIVADEPAASLDISIQAQILNLLDQTRKTGAALIYISHNLRITRLMTQKIAVMYCGAFVETGETESIFSRPVHPYTKLLIDSILTLNPDQRSVRRRKIYASDDDPGAELSGCKFQPRCPLRRDICRAAEPELKPVGKQHYVACHCARSI